MLKWSKLFFPEKWKWFVFTNTKLLVHNVMSDRTSYDVASLKIENDVPFPSSSHISLEDIFLTEESSALIFREVEYILHLWHTFLHRKKQSKALIFENIVYVLHHGHIYYNRRKQNLDFWENWVCSASLAHFSSPNRARPWFLWILFSCTSYAKMEKNA